ncbi:PREDICTED: uroplakin-3a [Nanorana parkeri]|uniref:uroplakin-3a n=1 Tax=Nanorana parkeri TaxID=125878 RepID=UPI0008543432|nr:PREDICTED: uroplakin-3a [Nanorana parkeri]
MGKCTYLLLFAWLLQNNLAVALVPLLASSNICKFNPTQTTIALEKPYCFYISPTSVTAYLYVVRNDATNTNLSPINSFDATKGGATAPYVAAIFSNPNCTNPPTTSQIYDLSQVQSTLNNYVVRVGNDDNCFNMNTCNKPLQSNTAYRFIYAFYDSTPSLVFRSDWSPPIYTKQGKDSGSIDTWPGRRSGGMIVITSILSVLTFFVLAGLVAAIITNLMTPSVNMEPSQHESRTSHTVPHKTGDVEYATALDPSERYVNPQA